MPTFEDDIIAMVNDASNHQKQSIPRKKIEASISDRDAPHLHAVAIQLRQAFRIWILG
jgi:hypothetical protein